MPQQATDIHCSNSIVYILPPLPPLPLSSTLPPLAFTLIHSPCTLPPLSSTRIHSYSLSLHSSSALPHSPPLVFTLNSLSLHSREDDIRKKKDAGDLYKELLQRRILHGWFSVVKARGKHMRMARRSIQVKSLLTSIINQLGKHVDGAAKYSGEEASLYLYIQCRV